MDLPAWNAIYADLPSKQLKLPVKNKDLITCSEDETSALTPDGLQEALNHVSNTTTTPWHHHHTMYLTPPPHPTTTNHTMYLTPPPHPGTTTTPCI
jgi:hypothetical protein